MKVLKKLFLGCLGLLLALVVVSQFLPGAYHIERSVLIHAKPDVVYPRVAVLKRWPEWSAWGPEFYPRMVSTYSGPESGVGAATQWQDPKSNGRLVVTKAEADRGVWYDMSMENDQFQAKGALLLEAAGAGTKLTWTDDGTLGRNPLHRFFGLFLEKLVAPDFEKGLARLKQQVEAGK